MRTCDIIVLAITSPICVILHTDPGVCPTQNSVNTRDFCTTSNNGKDFMFNHVARVLTKTCCLDSQKEIQSWYLKS